MSASTLLSSLALVISGASLALSLIALLRDRYRVSASARTPNHGKLAESVIVHAVNSGRRPLTLRRLALTARDGTHYDCPVGGQGPVRLMENEDHEFHLSLLDQDLQRCVEGDIMTSRLVDSRGRAWPVQGLTEIIIENVRKLSAPIA